MKAYLGFATATLAGLAFAALATGAAAGCGDGSWRKAQIDPTASTTPGALIAAAAPAVAPIVGMWSVTFVDPTGKVSDFGYQQWHSDGTEILNSGGRAPASENFCLGVWAAVHDNEYMLNHWALSYDPATGVLNAKVNVREDVHVGPGGVVFSGTYSQDVYDPKGDHLAHLTGTITGQRITLNQ